jgi:phage shock protein C
MKKLSKSKKNKVISGVCGGIAEYFNIDPSIVRILWAVISIFSAAFPGIILYIVCAVVMPEAPPDEPINDFIEYTDRSN